MIKITNTTDAPIISAMGVTVAPFTSIEVDTSTYNSLKSEPFIAGQILRKNITLSVVEKAVKEEIQYDRAWVAQATKKELIELIDTAAHPHKDLAKNKADALRQILCDILFVDV
jgi:hypothetical protein